MMGVVIIQLFMQFRRKKKKLLIILSAAIAVVIALLFYFYDPYYWLLENHYSKIYDLRNPQQPVTTKAGIDSVLKNFAQVSYTQLDKDYIAYSQSDVEKFKTILQGKIYYVVKGEDIFRFLVGNFRVKEFLVRDNYYSENLNNLEMNNIQYFLIDKNLLYAFLDLQDELQRKGYDRNAFTINNAHRHPSHNKEIGGASVSYHIRGQAIDLTIWDINKDGIPTQEDKKIVLDILDKKIIKDKGGIGRYPWSMVVHFDVRGHKARWDKQ